MSKYSTEVRFICESLAGYIEQQGYGSVDDILNTAAPLVFDFDFPIFDEDYRLGLEKKILKHFYTREICAETVGLWKLWLNERMNLIMPYYNKLYESELIEFNPMHDVDLDTTHTKTGEGSTTGSSTGSSVKVYEEDTTGNETLAQGVKLDEDTTEHGTTTGSKDVDDYDEKNSERTIATDESVYTSEKEVMADVISSSSSQTSSSTGTNDSSDAYSDTPQGSLTNVKNLAYLTNARVVDTDTTDSSSGSATYTGGEDKTTTTTGSKDTDKDVKDVYAETDGRQTNTTEAGEHQLQGSKDSTTTTNAETDTVGTKDSTTTTTNEGATTGGSTSTEEYIQNITGKRSLQSFSKYLIEFRQTFLNIDNMVINELNDLFIQLW